MSREPGVFALPAPRRRGPNYGHPPSSIGFVYFITSEPDRFVKIGWAKTSPLKRLVELQTGCPEPLRLMAYTPASRDEERRLQETFGELHHRGEWFYNQQKLLDLIQYLSEDYPRPTERMADRETFEGAIWDVVITGMEHPDMPDVESYRRSGQGRLWRHMYPEMMDYPDLVAELFA